MSQLSGKPSEHVEETKGDAGNLIVFDLRTLTHFREEEPYVQILSDIGAARLVLFVSKLGSSYENTVPPARFSCRRCVAG